MPDIKSKYGTDGVVIACTLTSLANAAARESDAVDNSSNLYLDALVQVVLKLSNAAPAGDKRCYVYAAGVINAASPTWPDTVTGADAAITLNSPTQLKLIGALEMIQNATSKSEPFSVAQAFGGILPVKWSIVILNSSGQALTGTGSDHTVKYQGILAQV
jgi:hypothetical protein